MLDDPPMVCMIAAAGLSSHVPPTHPWPSATAASAAVDWTAVGGIATLVACVASVFAAGFALVTIRQTAKLRHEARQQILADALITMINTTEKNPGHGQDPTWDARLLDAIHQVQRATGLSIIGLSAKITEPILGLLDPPNQEDPYLMFMYATKAFDELRIENGGEPIGQSQEPQANATAVLAFKRLLLRVSEWLRRAALRP